MLMCMLMLMWMMAALRMVPGRLHAPHGLSPHVTRSTHSRVTTTRAVQAHRLASLLRYHRSHAAVTMLLLLLLLHVRFVHFCVPKIRRLRAGCITLRKKQSWNQALCRIGLW
jgi:hypothetical protein